MKKSVVAPGLLKLAIYFLIAFYFSITSCRKDIGDKNSEITLPGNNNVPVTGKSVYVSSLEDLYEAVNNADNAGSHVILSPGTYVLSSAYENGGRLELQQNMSLQGQPGQQEAVLIDMSALPSTSFVLAVGGRTGGIRMGRGTNTLSWLTIKGGAVSAAPFSVINTDLFSTETTVQFSHVKIDVNGSIHGINLRNRLSEHALRKIFAELEFCEISGAVNGAGSGLAIQNANGASGSLINATLRENYLHNNRIGIFTFNTAQTTTLVNSSIEIKSFSDRIEGNGVGLDPSGGVVQTSTGVANNNSTTIKMYGSSISYNNPPGAPHLTPINGALPGAMYVAGGYNSVNNISGYNRASENIMIVECNGCKITGNNGTDIYAYGAFAFPAAVLAGTNNKTEIHLRGISSNATAEATNSIPFEPAGTNTVTIIRN